MLAVLMATGAALAGLPGSNFTVGDLVVAFTPSQTVELLAVNPAVPGADPDFASVATRTHSLPLRPSGGAGAH